jgi:hypothetical protein
MSGRPIHLRRLLLGGLVAGVLCVVLGFVLGHVVLREATDRMIRDGRPPRWAPVAITSLRLALGFVFVFAYAAMRPRFGGRTRTAVIAALTLWCAGHLPDSLLAGLTGRLAPGEAWLAAAWGALENVACTLAGAAVYREG